MPPSLDNPAVWALTQAKALLWLLVLTRLSGLLAALPGLGQERVPLQVRAALAVLMATIITPVIPGPKALPQSLWDVLAFMVMEFAVGLLLGLLVGWILEAVSMGGYLMDVQMGGMDGVEATRRIRSGESGVLDSRVPIIAMTAYAMAGDRDRPFE